MILNDYINRKWHYNTDILADYLVETRVHDQIQKKSVLFSVPFIILLPHKMNIRKN